MHTHMVQRIIKLSLLFIKEQLKEPAALFWMIISPGAVYYLLTYSRGGLSPTTSDYLENTSWFYAYISSSVAFFGFSFYIIGRRESGFIRSFIYTPIAKAIFLAAQLLSYSLISIIYCTVFYLLTRFSFETTDNGNYWTITGRFYICYLLFCIPGALLTLAPMNFQNANTVFSISSFTMLVLGLLSTRQTHPAIDFANTLNPLWLAKQIMTGGTAEHSTLIFGTLVVFTGTFLATAFYLRINPIWSRY
ncbi:ABC-2 type transport system permease protein [Pseudomonas sp. ok272]|uniref:ABC transporter permease n=1 Tax=unclassified Pseudomonas TaxID=196821 RepID=UPI0008CB5C64|nr:MULTISPECIES: ABC transporter permease [unclassified Pseudomonas]SEM45324.1 ABC-2 type transport system permease protein [Pseudomonas sp. ok272]SFM17075.1 ABC-2 type transport system permease protein [Pseudomonas sp. ok602]